MSAPQEHPLRWVVGPTETPQTHPRTSMGGNSPDLSTNSSLEYPEVGGLSGPDPSLGVVVP